MLNRSEGVSGARPLSSKLSDMYALWSGDIEDSEMVRTQWNRERMMRRPLVHHNYCSDYGLDSVLS